MRWVLTGLWLAVLCGSARAQPPQPLRPVWMSQNPLEGGGTAAIQAICDPATGATIYVFTGGGPAPADTFLDFVIGLVPGDCGRGPQTGMR